MSEIYKDKATVCSLVRLKNNMFDPTAKGSIGLIAEVHYIQLGNEASVCIYYVVFPTHIEWVHRWSFDVLTCID